MIRFADAQRATTPANPNPNNAIRSSELSHCQKHIAERLEKRSRRSTANYDNASKQIAKRYSPFHCISPICWFFFPQKRVFFGNNNRLGQGKWAHTLFHSWGLLKDEKVIYNVCSTSLIMHDIYYMIEEEKEPEQIYLPVGI